MKQHRDFISITASKIEGYKITGLILRKTEAVFFLSAIVQMAFYPSVAIAATRCYSPTSNNSGIDIFWWFIGIMAALLVLSVVIGIFSISGKKSSAEKEYNNGTYAKITSNTSKTTLYVPIEMIEGKIIDGHAIRNLEDRDRWNVKKGFSRAIHYHLIDLENTIVNSTSDKAKEAFDEWFLYYEKYRNLCLENGMWNDYIEDHAPFTASANQITKENQVKESIRIKYDNAELARNKEAPIFQAIIEYIKKQPKHTAQRSEMFNSIAGLSKCSKETVNKIYRKTVRAGILSERIIDHHYVAKITPVKRTPKLKPSVFKPEKYEKVDKYVRYKIEYTVGQPLNVDRISNTCEFVSRSNGERYYTSLEKCTCPANYGSRYACKHMVALAVYLGYYDFSKAK